MMEEDQHGFLSNAPLDMEYGNNMTEQSTATALNTQNTT